ncbi:hypothetical protein E2C01_011194 [Portunus trituberculatus]|uniref:Uncharacterized protein n=1 Tax=Portunus trituberculatus TaxID=210409 RepID=A0A5B7DAL1_PORTR|nr:hypothetical protein [Portunus trituberculatus]
MWYRCVVRDEQYARMRDADKEMYIVVAPQKAYCVGAGGRRRLMHPARCRRRDTAGEHIWLGTGRDGEHPDADKRSVRPFGVWLPHEACNCQGILFILEGRRRLRKGGVRTAPRRRDAAPGWPRASRRTQASLHFFVGCDTGRQRVPRRCPHVVAAGKVYLQILEVITPR